MFEVAAAAAAAGPGAGALAAIVVAVVVAVVVVVVVVVGSITRLRAPIISVASAFPAPANSRILQVQGTLGVYGISFACGTETIVICGVSSTSNAQNQMVYSVLRTEHPCPKPNESMA